MRRIVLMLLAGGLAWGVYSKTQQRAAPPEPLVAAGEAPAEEKPVDFFGTAASQPAPPHTAAAQRVAPRSAAAFACDGRTRCSQMHSCEEANYFLSHCPGVKMDGDSDGIPCERELCGQ